MPPRVLLSRWLLALSLSLLGSALFAQVDAKDLPPVSRSYVLTNVFIHPQPGQEIAGGTVLIKDGLIVAAGKEVRIPGEAIRIEADSMHVYAGFIDGLSQVGMAKQKDGDDRAKAPKDVGNPPPDLAGIQPQRMALDWIEAGSSDIEKLRSSGFTATQVVPQGGMLPGQGALITLGGDDVAELRLQQPTALFVQFEGARRMYPSNLLGIMATFKQLYRQAELATAHEARYASSPAGMARPSYPETVRALYPVVNGSLPAMFLTPKRKDVYRALALQDTLGFPLVLAGVQDGSYLIEALQGRKLPIFLSLDLPDKPDELKADSSLSDLAKAERAALGARRVEAYQMALQQAAKLHAAGIAFGFASYDVSSKDLPDHLRRLVQEGGLTPDAALAALTTDAATLMGVSQRLGSIEPGKIANLVVSDQPYFEEKAKVRMVFVDGNPYEIEKSKPASGKAANVLGTWTYTVDSPQGKSTGRLVFRGDQSAPEGSITSDLLDRESELEDISISGNTLSFSYTIDVGGGSLLVEVNATIDGDTFEGTATVGSYGTSPIEGERTAKPE
jgi:hypothetical protein